MIKYQGQKVSDQEKAYKLIHSDKLTCQNCDSVATDLHNHRKDPDDWQALCAICHAKVEAREEAWTPIGNLAVRYADIVTEINRMNNTLQARRKLGWDGLEEDFKEPQQILKEKQDKIANDIAKMSENHPIWDYFLKDVTGISATSAGLVISVMERAFNQDIIGIRDQRRYFGLAPDGVFDSKAENEKYHNKCKQIISQALANQIMMQMGMFGDRYKYHRKIVEDEHPDWSNGHQYNSTWIRVAREFMKALNLKWQERQGKEIGEPHPDDNSPQPEDWC